MAKWIAMSSTLCVLGLGYLLFEVGSRYAELRRRGLSGQSLAKFNAKAENLSLLVCLIVFFCCLSLSFAFKS